MQPPVVTAPQVTRVYGTALPPLVVTRPDSVPFAKAEEGPTATARKASRRVLTVGRWREPGACPKRETRGQNVGPLGALPSSMASLAPKTTKRRTRRGRPGRLTR